MRTNFLMAILFLFVFYGCKSESPIDEEDPVSQEELASGSNNLDTNFLPFKGKTIKVYYYLPESFTKDSRIVFIFHGTDRNAEDYRDAWVNKAIQYNFMAVVPEFSEENFPGGDAYNLGNVFIDGDHPSASTLNPEDEWTFSIIEPLFDFIKQKINNESETYLIFGHSAGAQFAHRFVMFEPNARVEKVVASASGWYTLIDTSTDFPYGFQNSPLMESDISGLLSKELIIQVGELDNDPNSSGLRHNEIVDMQGLNRFVRGRYFFEMSQEFARNNNLPFEWKFIELRSIGHDYKTASKKAADLLFTETIDQ